MAEIFVKVGDWLVAHRVSDPLALSPVCRLLRGTFPEEEGLFKQHVTLGKPQ